MLVVKNPPANAKDLRDMDLIPGAGRFPRGGHGNPLQNSCLENPMDRGAWQAMVHRITQSDTTGVTACTHIFPGIALVEVFISSLLISHNSFLPFPSYSFPDTPNFSVFQWASNLILLFSNKNPLIVFCSHTTMLIIFSQVFKQNFNLSLKLHFQLF